jgi:hypothetical protein
MILYFLEATFILIQKLIVSQADKDALVCAGRSSGACVPELTRFPLFSPWFRSSR